MKTIKQKISHAVNLHAKLISLCCAVLCAAVANAATFTDVLTVSYEGGLTPMATRTYSGGISTAGITKPDWIGATKLKMDSAAGTTQVGFEVKANTSASSREWTCTLPLGTDTWQITVKQAGKPEKLVSNFGFPKVEQLKGTSFAAWGNPLHLRLSDPSSQPESYDPIYPSYYEGAKPWFHALVVNLGDSAMTKLPDLKLEVINLKTDVVACSTTVAGPIGNVAAHGGCVSVYAQWNALAELTEGSYMLRATWIAGAGQTDPDTSDNKASFNFSVEKFVPFALMIEDGVLLGWEGECPKKLEIPEGVKAIGSFLGASKGGWDVEEVVLPTSVTDIGDYAFGGFDSLTKVTLPEGLKTIGWGAFECCPALESISIPSTVEYVDAQAFIDTGLKSVVFHSPKTVFDSMAFTALLQVYSDWIYGLNENLQSVTLDAPGFRLTGWQLVAVGTADKSKEKVYDATDLGAFSVYPDVNTVVDYSAEHYVVTPVVEEVGTCSLGFPDASTLTDTYGWAAPIVIYDPNDGKAQKDYNAIAKFEKGAGVYFKFVMENKGKTDFPYADFKAEILNELGIQVAHFTKASDSGTHVAGSIKCSWGWDWPALQNLSAGKYRLQITLDPESVTGDQDDSDNVAKINFEVTESPADLPNYAFYKIAGFPNGAFLTDSPTATVEKTTFVKGEPVYVRFCVGNFGKGEAADGETISFAIDSGEPVTDKAGDVLKAGKARMSVTTIGTEKMSVGKHTVMLVINNEMTHAETSYDDNVAELSFELIDPVVPTYTVAFDANGGEGTVAAQTFKCGETEALPANAFVRGGHEFIGWAKTADGAVAYADKAQVKDLGGQGATVTLYAVWKLISNPDVLPNFGFYKPEDFPDSVFLTDSPTSLIPKSSFEKGETVYIRFCVGNFGKGVAAAGEMTSVIVDEDVPVDAVAQDVLVAGGGRMSVINIGTEKMSAGSHRVTLVVNNEQTIDETSYDDNVKIVTFDLVDPAVPTYVVAFDANGGEGTMAPQTLSCGVEGILSGNAFVKSGCEFAGWATSAAGDVAYADKAAVKDLVKANNKVVLYAVWKDAQQSKFTIWAEQSAGAYTGSVTFDGNYALTSKGLPDWVKSVLIMVGASKYSLDASVKCVPIAGVADITVNVTSNESMTARTADWTIAGTDGTPDIVVTLAQEGRGKVTSYKITYLETKGQGNANPSSYTRDDEIVFKPLPDTVKYRFLGWSPSSIAKGSAGDVTVTALWEEKKPDPLPDDDILDTSVANVLDGSVYDDDYALVGTVQIKTAKANKSSGLSKVTASITILGQSKVTVKGDFDASKGVFEAKDKSGKLLSLVIWENDFTGEYGDYIIEGARNVFSSKKDEDKRSANEALAVCQGTYALTLPEEDGWSALSVSVDKKGKVKVSGTLANGTKVSATSQLVVGPDAVFAPIVVSKKNLQLAFGLSFYDGDVEVTGFDDDDAFCEPVGGLDEGLCFFADGIDFLYSDDVEVQEDFLPSGTEILPNGKKWIVSPDENGKAMKAGKLVWDKKEEDVNWDKSKIEGYNVSNLKLSYTAKTGLFKGSFKVYYVENGQKLKTTTFTVNGIVVGGQGYGTARAKKLGSVAVTIE